MRPALLPLAALVLFTTACPCPDDQTCDDSTLVEPSNVIGFRLDDGDTQVGPAGRRLVTPLSVRTFDTGSNAPVATLIRFSIESGGGGLAIVPHFGGTFVNSDQVLNVQTDANGFAGALLDLGLNPGENRVKAELVPGNRFIRFTATGHGPAAVVTIDGGDGQSAEIGAELADRVAVKVTDANGIQVPDLRVWFVPGDGGLPVDGEVTNTSKGGVAQMASRWRLGPGVGLQSLEARVLEGATGSNLATLTGNPVRFTATALAPAPASVARNPGSFPEPQNGAAGQPVGIKPSVRVADAAGRALAGVAVRFVVTSGNGTLGGLLTTHERPTDQAGIVTVPDWILGAVGTNTVTATVQANGVAGNPVTFTANAAALSLAIVAGNNQSGPIDASFPVKPRVRVTNANGVGVGGIRINWTVTRGAGSFLVSVPDTDPEGYAQVDYFGPTEVGTIQLRAATADTRVSPSSVTFTFTGNPRP